VNQRVTLNASLPASDTRGGAVSRISRKALIAGGSKELRAAARRVLRGAACIVAATVATRTDDSAQQ